MPPAPIHAARGATPRLPSRLRTLATSTSSGISWTTTSQCGDDPAAASGSASVGSAGAFDPFARQASTSAPGSGSASK